ncbi:MAG: hypothetical protein HZB53_03705 [Chloroflexi bacterium]|nr:hypothetical protein [Chloroflexota bacterium]
MQTDQAIARSFSPVIYCDDHEPFLPVCAGWSVLAATAPAPSFQREIEVTPPVARVIEYAVWFDWDIGHLNELEQLWVYLDADDNLAGVEGSWHGFYRSFNEGGMTAALEDGHPVAYAKPGKHALVADPAVLDDSRAECERDCGPLAGRGGVQVTHLTLGRIEKTPEADALARAYLQQRRFAPAWRFTRRVALTGDRLMPWETLAPEIPRRVNDWIARLRAGAA